MCICCQTFDTSGQKYRCMAADMCRYVRFTAERNLRDFTMESHDELIEFRQEFFSMVTLNK